MYENSLQLKMHEYVLKVSFFNYNFYNFSEYGRRYSEGIASSGKGSEGFLVIDF